MCVCLCGVYVHVCDVCACVCAHGVNVSVLSYMHKYFGNRELHECHTHVYGLELSITTVYCQRISMTRIDNLYA